MPCWLISWFIHSKNAVNKVFYWISNVVLVFKLLSTKCMNQNKMKIKALSSFLITKRWWEIKKLFKRPTKNQPGLSQTQKNQGLGLWHLKVILPPFSTRTWLSMSFWLFTFVKRSLLVTQKICVKRHIITNNTLIFMLEFEDFSHKKIQIIVH